MKLGSSRGMDTKRPRGSERSKPCHQLRLTRRSQPPYPWPPEQAQPGVSKPCRTAVRANLGRKPREISADAGYCSEDNLLALATRKIQAYVATGRAKHPAETTRKVGGEMTQKMRQKLKRAGYRSRYRLRKQIVEPVFGQIKQARVISTIPAAWP